LIDDDEIATTLHRAVKAAKDCEAQWCLGNIQAALATRAEAATLLSHARNLIEALQRAP